MSTAENALGTSRERAKAQRRSALLHAAADLFAARGFERVSLEDLGAAVGISGPAGYRHFAGQQAVVASSVSPGEKLRELVAFHVEFALSNADVILVQDRDLDSLIADDLAT